MNDKFHSIVNNPNDHHLQIIYTQIDRNSDQKPIFTQHAFNLDDKKYFYPASTVKFPAAVLALEKLKEYKAMGINKDTKLTISSDKEWMSSVLTDSSSKNQNATVGCQ